MINFYIKRYSKISQQLDDSELSRTRDLLLNKKEIAKIRADISQKGKSCVPLNLRIEHGLFKIEIAVVRGRREYEKKVVAKEKQEKFSTGNSCSPTFISSVVGSASLRLEQLKSDSDTDWDAAFGLVVDEAFPLLATRSRTRKLLRILKHSAQVSSHEFRIFM